MNDCQHDFIVTVVFMYLFMISMFYFAYLAHYYCHLYSVLRAQKGDIDE